jgi:hypothetical protein
MPDDETKKAADAPKPALPPQDIGEDKCAEVDALPPTPEREAKTGEK